MVSSRSRLAPFRQLVPLALAALAAVLLLGCGKNNGAPARCAGAPLPGELSLWASCDTATLSGEPLPLELTNGSAEPAWLYHHCHHVDVPWLAALEDDGSWTSLLPPGTSLGFACHHVHVLAPGESLEIELGTSQAQGPGTYRAELLVGRDCGDLHDPRHLVAACSRIELLTSEPLTLH